MWVNVRKILLFMRDTCRIHAWSRQLFPQHKGIGSFSCTIFLKRLTSRWMQQTSCITRDYSILSFLEKISHNFHKNSCVVPASSTQNPCEFGGFLLRGKNEIFMQDSWKLELSRKLYCKSKCKRWIISFFCRSSKYECNGSHAKLTTHFLQDPLRSYFNEQQLR